MRDSVDWGGVSSHNSLAGVSLICGVVDVGSLNNLLDGVNLVGSWDMDGTRDGNLIRLGNVGDLDNLTRNGTWDSNGDINVVFLDIDLWDNVGDLRGDSGVASHGSSNLGLDNVDVPVAVPRAVPREIVQVSHVAKPYEVPVPRAVHVPAPYKVHPVQEIVETPHIHHATVETHSSQAVVTAHATPVHAVSHVPVAAAAPVAAVHAAPAAVGYAGYAGHAVAAPAAVGYAGYAGHAIAAPALGYAGHAVAAPAVVA